MSLASRLKALSKRVAALERDVEQGGEVSPFTLAALMQLEAALDELDKTLPPVRRGRPKQPDIVLHLLRFYVDGIKALPNSGVTTQKEALQRLLRKHKGRLSLHTLENKLGKERKAPK